MSSTIRLLDYTGTFAEDKDVARALRTEQLEPALGRRETVTLDFTGVPLATQSFLHALLSAVIRSTEAKMLDRVVFKGCSPAVKSLIKLVCEYSQETDAERQREPGSVTVRTRKKPRTAGGGRPKKHK